MSTSSWKAKLPFLERSKPISHKVQGIDLNFYPSSMHVVFKTKNVLAPIFASLSLIFGNKDNDFGTIQRTFVSSIDPKKNESEIVAEAIKLDLAEFRSKERAGAIKQVFDAINQDNLDAIGELVMDSLRETFPRGDLSNPPSREFVQTIELPTLVSMLLGVAKANKGVFGPLGDRLLEAIEKVAAGLQEKAGSLNPIGKVMPSDSIPGSNSKTKSAGSTSEDTPSIS